MVAFGDRDVVLFISEGEAEVTISGRTFTAQTRSGVYVAPGEAFRVAGKDSAAVRFLASAGPPRRRARVARPDAGQLRCDPPEARRSARPLPAPGHGQPLFPDARRPVGRLEGRHPVHRPHTALEGRAPPPSLRGGPHHPLRRGLHVDREPQGPVSGRGTSSSCRESNSTPSRRPAPKACWWSARSTPGTTPRSTTEGSPALATADGRTARPEGRRGIGQRHPRGGRRTAIPNGRVKRTVPAPCSRPGPSPAPARSAAGAAPGPRRRARDRAAARPPPGCGRRGSAG